MARDAVWLGGVAPSYAAAEAILQRIGHTNISATSIWRRVQAWGAQFQAVEERARVQLRRRPNYGRRPAVRQSAISAWAWPWMAQ